MLKGLLAERFHLVIHETTKPMAAWALTAGKHGGLKESDGSGEGCKFIQPPPQAPPQPPAPGSVPRINLPVLSFECKNATMASLASTLTAAPGAAGYFDNKPVVDKTGLEGSWDFSFRYTPKIPVAVQAQVSGESIPLTDSMEKQLGLKLEASTVPAPVLAVDSVDEKPTPNPANLTEILPPLPAEFDVAEIKVSPPQTGPQQVNQAPQIKNGRFFIPNITMRNLIQVAWDLNGNEFLIGPKWIDDDRFDIIAKAPSEVAMGDLDNVSPTGDPAEYRSASAHAAARCSSARFKIVSHMEDRPMNAMILTAPKPKLTKADPAERTKWSEGTGGAAPETVKKANPSLGRLVTCQNVSMAQFAEMLPQIAGGYVRTDVVNKTGLEGGWDFTFSFSPIGLLNQVAGKTDNGDAADPNGAISLQDALMKQLGLKLDTEKRPTPVLVIDKIEKMPTEN